MPAPHNPYRAVEGRLETGFEMPPPVPRRHDGEEGPGLLAADIDRLCRQHYLDGMGQARRDEERRIAGMREQRAEIYDEGFDAGVAQRRAGLAEDFRVRLLDVHFTLQALERGPKAKAHERAEAVRAALGEVMSFASAIASGQQLDAAVDP